MDSSCGNWSYTRRFIPWEPRLAVKNTVRAVIEKKEGETVDNQIHISASCFFPPI